MADRFTKYKSELHSPASGSFDIVPGPTDFNVATRAIYVGVSGNVVAKLVNDGNTFRTFASVPIGIFPIRAVAIANTSTANSLVGLY